MRHDLGERPDDTADGSPLRHEVERLGGLDHVRTILADFYDRVFDDFMIGFMFRHSDKALLVEREAELTARALGLSQVKYAGRPMRGAHGPHQIMGGQFARRLQLLRETLVDHAVPSAVRDAWIAHNEALRHLVTRDPGRGCAVVAAMPGSVDAARRPHPVKGST